jgi:magnesium transporter
MEREALVFPIRDALARGDDRTFPQLVKQNHYADIAEALAELEPAEVRTLLLQIPAETRAELFGYFDLERQVAIIGHFNRRELTALFFHMSADERVDLFNQLDAETQEKFLPAMAQVEREDIRRLAAYEEGTIGAVITSDYATLTPQLTAREAIERLRRVAPDKETIYQSFVVDETRRLLGTVSLRDLIVAPAHARVEQIMVTDVISARADAPAEEAAKLIARYDLIALPVTDEADKLIGIVTYDDAQDVAEAEATEDFLKAGGASGEVPLSLRNASIRALYRSRVFWLVALVFGNLFSGAGIAYFEATIAEHLALLFFLPLLIASAGNAGSQAATMMVRSMATGDVHLRDWGRLLGREFRVAALLGGTMAAAISGIGWFRAGSDIALVVSVTMLTVVIMGSLIGMSLPFILSRFRFDPAAASGPLVTSIADACGVLIYFSLAVVLLDAPIAG